MIKNNDWTEIRKKFGDFTSNIDRLYTNYQYVQKKEWRSLDLDPAS